MHTRHMASQATGTSVHGTGLAISVKQQPFHFVLQPLWRVLLFVALVSATYVLMTEGSGIPIAHAETIFRAASANTAVLTYKYDDFRTGQNPNETILNESNVNSSHFGKHVSYPVDGNVYAQPLYAPNLTIGGHVHNVVFVATEHDSVYAFDADARSAIAPLWHSSFINPSHGITTISSSVQNCGNISPEYGITGTPVIDANSNTLYVVASTKENGSFFQRLHALDILTGHEKPGSPVAIKAAVKGTGDGSINGVIHFNPFQQLQRPGLLLLNGVVYIAFGSHCDHNPYHGWVMGYTASTLQKAPNAVWNSTRNAGQGAIWQSGGGLAADASGNIYFMTGNGNFDANNGGRDFGDTLVKLATNTGLRVSDYFTPFNQQCLNGGDIDLGSGAPVLLPTSNEIVAIGKEGRIYVVSRTNMGKFTSINNPCNNQNLTNVDKVLQEFAPGTIAGGAFSTPVYWNGSIGEQVFTAGASDHVKAYKLSGGLLSSSPTSQTPESFSFHGCNPVVSSNGTVAQTGILWVIDPSSVLRAYAADNLGRELFNSRLPSYVTFSTPTVTNGEVFIGTSSTLEIYGLL
jgi:hypothetical protein